MDTYKLAVTVASLVVHHVPWNILPEGAFFACIPEGKMFAPDSDEWKQAKDIARQVCGLVPCGTWVYGAWLTGLGHYLRGVQEGMKPIGTDGVIALYHAEEECFANAADIWALCAGHRDSNLARYTADEIAEFEEAMP